MNTETYPYAPGWKAQDTETSRESAHEFKAPASKLREQAERVLQTFADVTADEAARFLGVSVLAMRPRFSELVKQGKAEDSGKRRTNNSGKSAVAWRLVRRRVQGVLL